MKHLLIRLTLAASLLGTTLCIQAADAPSKPVPKEPTPVATGQDAGNTAAQEIPLQKIPAPLLPRVRIQTSLGDMILELYDTKAPKTVANFLSYVREGTYDGTIFHRVIHDFMVQGGVYSADYKPRYTRAPIPTEATNGLKNERGTIAMAREYDPDSATNQFFINVVDNRILNHHSPTPGHWGYAVFGKVAEGLDVLDRIRNLPTGAGGPFDKEVPQTQVLIKKISIEPSAPSVFLSAEEQAAKELADAKAAEEKKAALKASKKPAKKKTKPKPATASATTPAKTDKTGSPAVKPATPAKPATPPIGAGATTATPPGASNPK